MPTLIEEIAEVEAITVKHLPDLFEIINGKVVETSPMSADSLAIANELGFHLSNHVHSNNLGRTYVEMIFQIPLPDQKERGRRPDLAFVSFARWPAGKPVPRVATWKVVPELAVEVISRHDSVEELMDKVNEYFAVGVKLVWVIYPKQRWIHIFESVRQIRVLTHEDELDGGALFPGFRVSIASFLPEIQEEENED